MGSVHATLTLGVTVWSLGTFEMPEWGTCSPFERDPIDVLRMLAAEPGSPEGMFQVTEALLHRRRTLFGEDRRCIVDFELLRDPESDFRLRCTGGLP